ncbi:hypothetical protein GQX74_009739 [Glossina fuscipes]|nr:hypothetical protein GQX74_009739 [Glossina fuscipes]
MCSEQAPIVKLPAFDAVVIPGPELTILDGFNVPVNTLELTITFDGGDMVFVAESNPKPAAAAAAAVTMLGASIPLQSVWCGQALAADVGAGGDVVLNIAMDVNSFKNFALLLFFSELRVGREASKELRWTDSGVDIDTTDDLSESKGEENECGSCVELFLSLWLWLVSTVVEIIAAGAVEREILAGSENWFTEAKT